MWQWSRRRGTFSSRFGGLSDQPAPEKGNTELEIHDGDSYQKQSKSYTRSEGCKYRQRDRYEDQGGGHENVKWIKEHAAVRQVANVMINEWVGRGNRALMAALRCGDSGVASV